MKKPFSQNLQEFFLGQLVGVGTMVAAAITFFVSFYIVFSIAPLFFLWIATRLPDALSIYAIGFAYAGSCVLTLFLTTAAAYQAQKWLAARMNKFNK